MLIRIGLEMKSDEPRIGTADADLLAEIAAVLFRHDPIGLAFGENHDEYHPEASTIIPHLESCRSAEDVRRLVHREFVRWFDGETAGPEGGYEGISHEIWAVWNRYRGRQRARRWQSRGWGATP
jgi:hypothetical protein